MYVKLISNSYQLTSFDGDPVGTLEGDWLGILLGLFEGVWLGVDVGYSRHCEMIMLGACWL